MLLSLQLFQVSSPPRCQHVHKSFDVLLLNCVTIQLLQCFVNSFLYTGKMDDFVDMILKSSIPISNFLRWLVLLMKYIAYVSRLLQLLKMKYVSP